MSGLFAARVRAVALLGVVLLFGVAALAAGSGEAGKGGKGGKKVAIYDLFGQKQIKPERIFLTANSGPYLDELEWRGWRSGKAVAEGVYISDCASCAPPERRQATVVLKRLERCKAKGGRAYRKALLTTGADYTNEPRKVEIPAGYEYCRKNF